MFLNVCICTTCMEGPAEHKSLLDLMELEFQTVVNYLCVSRNQTWVLSKSKCYYLVRYLALRLILKNTNTKLGSMDIIINEKTCRKQHK